MGPAARHHPTRAGAAASPPNARVGQFSPSVVSAKLLSPMVHPVQSVVESLYADGRCPRLHVNAISDGVDCPDFIREQWQERLIIDLDSSYPLDLTFDEVGLTADLSFGGFVSRCSFPFQSIYVVADRATGRGVVLEENMPEAVRKARKIVTTGPLPGHDADAADERPQRQPQPQPQPAHDLLVEANEPDGEDEPPEQDEQAQKRRAAFKVIDGGG